MMGRGETLLELTKLEIAMVRIHRQQHLRFVQLAVYGLLFPLSLSWGNAVDTIADRSYYDQATSDIINRSLRATKKKLPDRDELEQVRFERTQKYAALIDHYSHRNHLDPNLVRAVIYIESGGDVGAISSKGAVGLMQLMPQTALELGVSDRTNPEQSIAGGTAYLREQFNRFGSTELVLWAYNGGPSSVISGNLSAEIQSYVQEVLRVRSLFSRRLLRSSLHAFTEEVNDTDKLVAQAPLQDKH